MKYGFYFCNFTAKNFLTTFFNKTYCQFPTMSAFQKYRYNNLLVNTKDYVMIVVGLMIYAIGFTACILPHKVVMGGLTGVGTLVYFATDGAVSVAVTSYACNLLLLAMAYKIVGRTFVLRTIYSATVIALSLGIFENFFMGIGHPLIPDRVVSIVLGAICCGIGIGTCFIHNGSTGEPTSWRQWCRNSAMSASAVRSSAWI